MIQAQQLVTIIRISLPSFLYNMAIATI